MKISGDPVPAPTNAPGSFASPAKLRWLTWESCSAWKSHASPGTTPIGIACGNSAASPILSLAITTARRVWLWFRSESLSFPLQTPPAGLPGPIRWVVPTYTALHHILTHPVYAGAYTYGKTKYERYVDEHPTVRKRIRHLPLEQGAVLLLDHHPG